MCLITLEVRLIKIFSFHLYGPIYRGKTFRFDQEGNRAKLTDNQLFELGMSFWITPPIKAEDNPIRSDLRDLDYVGEIALGLYFD